MIIQKVIKGIGGIERKEVTHILKNGIICRWWQSVGTLSAHEIPQRLTDRNLDWHQNRYADPDPNIGNQPFCEMTPFISTTAGTVERSAITRRNTFTPAWLEALMFATDFWRRDGYLFYCYLFVLGKKSVGQMSFAEELRELNIFTDFSPFQPEGEITAKIIIPPAQIERCEFWEITKFSKDLEAGMIPTPAEIISSPLHLPAEDYNNVSATYFAKELIPCKTIVATIPAQIYWDF